MQRATHKFLIKSLNNQIHRSFGFAYTHGVSNEPLLYKTIGQQLKETTEKYPDNIVLNSRHQKIKFTYSEFLKRSEQIAASLIQLGFEKGDRIGIYSPNNVEWALTQFATSLADLILVNVNPAYRISELSYVLKKVQCKGLILSPQFKSSNYIQMLQELVPETSKFNGRNLKSKEFPDLKLLIQTGEEHVFGFLNFKDLYTNHDESHIQELQRVQNNAVPEDPINIQFTSGTTGRPKGATLSHHNVLNNAYLIGNNCRYTNKDSVCVTVPLYHCFGMVMANLAMVCRGGKLVYPDESFNAQAALQAVHDERITSLYGVPTMFIEMLKVNEQNKGRFDLSSIRTGIIAGSLAPRLVVEKIIKELNCKEITNCYGMTETSPVSFQTSSDDSIEDKVSTVGRILPHLEGKIVDLDGRIVHHGFPGELWVRGATVMLKYWDDPENTAKSMYGGWMKTGDLAEMDDRGYVKIVGRNKDMIIRGGENVYPKELEEFLIQHSQIEDVQVIGVHDEKFGEEIAALIKPKDPKDAPKKEEIFEYCKGKIAHYKIPKYVKFVHQLPMTITGKPQKFIMRDELNKELQDPSLVFKYKVR